MNLCDLKDVPVARNLLINRGLRAFNLFPLLYDDNPYDKKIDDSIVYCNKQYSNRWLKRFKRNTTGIKCSRPIVMMNQSQKKLHCLSLPLQGQMFFY